MVGSARSHDGGSDSVPRAVTRAAFVLAGASGAHETWRQPRTYHLLQEAFVFHLRSECSPRPALCDPIRCRVHCRQSNFNTLLCVFFCRQLRSRVALASPTGCWSCWWWRCARGPRGHAAWDWGSHPHRGTEPPLRRPAASPGLSGDPVTQGRACGPRGTWGGGACR